RGRDRRAGSAVCRSRPPVSVSRGRICLHRGGYRGGEVDGLIADTAHAPARLLKRSMTAAATSAIGKIVPGPLAFTNSVAAIAAVAPTPIGTPRARPGTVSNHVTSALAMHTQ